MAKLSTLISNYFFVREVQKNGDVSLCYCKTENQVVDLFTKPLPAQAWSLRQKIGVCSSKIKEEC